MYSVQRCIDQGLSLYSGIAVGYHIDKKYMLLLYTTQTYKASSRDIYTPYHTRSTSLTPMLLYLRLTIHEAETRLI